ncbi:MAG: hypothetical protein EBR91_10955 [Flavobacteriia bacterium]|nr:hypothetical protein [Flavobacteriia bacterium]
MKKLFLNIAIFSTFLGVNAQSRLHKIESNLTLHSVNAKNKNQLKNMNCQDTLRYGLTKEEILSANPTYFFLDLHRADNDEMSLAFLSNFTNSIHGVEIYARRNSTSQAQNVVVQASIYSANQSFEPSALIGSATLNITNSANFQYYTFNFPVPLTVNGNYCVVIKPITTNGIIDLTVNDAAVSSHDELFCRFKSDGFASSSGQWISIPSFVEFGPTPANFEPLVAPIVSYPLQTQITANEQIICKGENLALNAQINPNGIYGNRFYNWYSFLSHFNPGTIDSTLNWQTPNSTISINSYGTQTNVQYNTVAQHNVTLLNNFGLYTTCLDQDTLIVTINQPNTSAGNDTAICAGESVSLSGSGANSYTWNNNIQNGVAFTPTSTNTYIVTGQSIYGCTKSDTAIVVVNPLSTGTITESHLDSVVINGITYFESGTYQQILTNVNGCDSTLTINLTMSHTGINDHTIGSGKILNYFDLNGKVIPKRKNTFMFAVYQDGEIKRVFEME